MNASAAYQAPGSTLRALPEPFEDALSRRHELRLLWAACLFLAALIIWSALAPIDKIVRAQGRIVAAGRAQVVQHLEGGIVETILVREGQKVLAGDVLMRLSDINANSSLQQAQTRLNALGAQMARLQAEAQGKRPEFDINTSADLKLREQKAYEERQARVNAETSAYRQQVSQKRSELLEAQSRSKSLANELKLAQRQATLMDGLHKKGAASQMELLDAQSAVERLNTQYQGVLNSLPRLLSAQAESVDRVQESIARFRSEARTELNQVAAEINRLNAAVGADSDRVSRTDVRAPTAGFVNRLYFNTLGGVIKPGEAVLEITPSEGPLAVEAQVRPDDRASLRAGLPARVMIGAYDYTVYGALTGEVTEVSADTVPDANGQRFYRIVVHALPSEGPLASEVILPGMTVSTDVVVGQRSVLSYLLSPLLRFATRAGREPR